MWGVLTYIIGQNMLFLIMTSVLFFQYDNDRTTLKGAILLEYLKRTKVVLTEAKFGPCYFLTFQLPAEYIKGAHPAKVMVIVSKGKLPVFLLLFLLYLCVRCYRSSIFISY